MAVVLRMFKDFNEGEPAGSPHSARTSRTFKLSEIEDRKIRVKETRESVKIGLDETPATALKGTNMLDPQKSDDSPRSAGDANSMLIIEIGNANGVVRARAPLIGCGSEIATFLQDAFSPQPEETIMLSIRAEIPSVTHLDKDKKSDNNFHGPLGRHSDAARRIIVGNFLADLTSQSLQSSAIFKFRESTSDHSWPAEEERSKSSKRDTQSAISLTNLSSSGETSIFREGARTPTIICDVNVAESANESITKDASIQKIDAANANPHSKTDGESAKEANIHKMADEKSAETVPSQPIEAIEDNTSITSVTEDAAREYIEKNLTRRSSGISVSPPLPNIGITA